MNINKTHTLKNRILSVLLTLTLVFGMMPAVAVKAEATGFVPYEDCFLLDTDIIEGTKVQCEWYQISKKIDGKMVSRQFLVFSVSDDPELSILSARIPDYTDATISDRTWQTLEGLEEVWIEDGVEGIGNNAFNGITSLKKLVVGSDVTSIGNNAFSECVALNTIDLSNANSLTSIGSKAFYKCGTISTKSEFFTTLDLSHSPLLTTIGSEAFSECSKLTSINFAKPGALTTIGKNAFYRCSALTSIDGSGLTSLTTIGNNAFYECSYLTNVDFSGCTALNNIGQYAFYNCDRLTDIDFSGCTTAGTLGPAAFYSCNALKNLKLPALTSIGNRAIGECTKLESISFENPGALTSIGVHAFGRYDTNTIAKLTGLENKIDFTKFTGLTTLGEGAFYGRQLGEVDLSATKLTEIPKYAFYRAGISGELKLPSTLVTIGVQAFDSNSMTSVTIPEKVATIGESAFSYNIGLADITINSTVLSDLGKNAFGSDHTTAYSEIVTVEKESGVLVNIEIGQTIRFSAASEAADVDSLFITSENCYYGAGSALRRDTSKDVPPTCTEPGKIVYFIAYGDTAVVKYIYEEGAPALGHNLCKDEENSIDADCEHDGYDLMKCSRCDYTERQNETSALGHTWDIRVTPATAGEGGYTETYCTRCSIVKEINAVAPPLGYNWVADNATVVSDSANGTIEYHQGASDTPDASYVVTVPMASISGKSGMKLSELPLPNLPAEEGSLAWKEPNQVLSYKQNDASGKQKMIAVFTPNNVTGVSQRASSAWRANPLTVEIPVEITVEKGVISFAPTYFSGVQVVQGTDAINPAVVNSPIGVSLNGDISNTYSNTMGAGTSYDVTAIFTYDPEDFDFNATQTPPTGYVLQTDGNNISLVYTSTVLSKDLGGVTISPAPSKTYDSLGAAMVTLSPLPSDAYVSYTAVKPDGTTISGNKKLDKDSTTIPGLETINAGTYNITISLSPADGTAAIYEKGSVETVVLPKPLPLPTGKTLTWNGTSQEGVDISSYPYDANITRLNYIKTDAGQYESSVRIFSDNYCWSDNTTTAAVNYSIVPRAIMIPTTRKDAEGQPVSANYDPSQSFTAVVTNGYAEDHTVIDGNSLKVYLDAEKTILLYTVENGVGTNAGTYDPVAKLNSTSNMVWADNTTADQLLSSFRVKPAVLPAEGFAINVDILTYDGAAHGADAIHMTKPTGWSDAQWDAAETSFEIYTSYQMDEASKISAAINAGTYYVRATAALANYAPISRDVIFVIGKAAAPTLGVMIDAKKPGDDGYSSIVSYDGNSHSMTPYIVSGLVAGETDDDPSTAESKWDILVAGIAQGSEAKEYGATFTLSHPNYEDAKVSGSMSVAKNDQELVPAIYKDGVYSQVPDNTLTAKFGDPAYTLAALRIDNQPGAGSYTITSSDSTIAVAENTGHTVTVQKQGETDIIIAYTGDDNWEAGSCILHLIVTDADQLVEASAGEGVTVDNEELTIDTTYSPNMPIAVTFEAKTGYGAHAPTGSVLSYSSDRTDIVEISAENKLIIKAAGTAHITVTAAAAGAFNCREQAYVFTVTVAPAKLTADVAGYVGTYNAISHDAVIINSVQGVGNDTELKNSASLSVSYTTSQALGYSTEMPAITTAGSIDVYYKLSFPNYEDYISSVCAVVSKAAITATASDKTMDFASTNVPTWSMEYTGEIVEAQRTDIETALNTSVSYEVKKIVGETPSGDNLIGSLGTQNAGSYAIIPVLNEGVMASYEVLSNYEVTPANGTLAIGKIDAVYTISCAAVHVGETPRPEVERNGNQINSGYTIEHTIKNDSESAPSESAGWAQGMPDAPGNYWIRAVIEETENYKAATACCEFKRLASQVQIGFYAADGTTPITELNVPYTGAPVADADYKKATHLPAVSAEYKFYTNGECTILFNDGHGGNIPTEVGTYYLKVTGSQTHYTDNSASVTFNITSAPLVITITTGSSVVTEYTAAYQDVLTLNYKLSTAAQNEVSGTLTATVPEEFSDYVTAEVNAATGTLTLTIRKVNAANTDIPIALSAVPTDARNHANGNAVFNLTITPANMVVNFTPSSNQYDGTAHNAASLSVNAHGNDITGDVQVWYSKATELNGLNYTSVGTNNMPTVTHVSECDGELVYYYVKHNSDYYAPVAGSFTEGSITARPVTVTVKPQSSIYGDAISVSSEKDIAWTQGSNVISSDDLQITLTKADGANAGTYNITGVSANRDYNVSFTGTENAYTISPRPVTVTINPQSSIYSGSVPSLAQVKDTNWSVTSGNLIGADDLSVTLFQTVLDSEVAAPNANAGSYDIFGSSENANYAVTFQPGLLTINRKNIADASIDAIVNGSYTYSGATQNPVVNASFGALTLASGIDFTTACSNKDAGIATVTMTGTGNYTGTKDVEFTILQKQLTITADAASKTYGEKSYSKSVQYDGFVSGENDGNLAGTASYTLKKLEASLPTGEPLAADEAAIATLNVGSYAIVPGGLSSSNYDIQFVHNVLTVNAKSISGVTTTLDSATERIYKGSEYIPDITVSDIQDGTVLLTINDYTVSYARTDGTGATDGLNTQEKPVDAGTYKVIITGQSNYDSATSKELGSFTIKPKTVSADLTLELKNGDSVVDSNTYTYSGAEQTPAVEITDTVRGEKLEVNRDYTISWTPGRINAGTYTVTITFQKNYYGTPSKNAFYTINQKDMGDLVCNLSQNSYVYSGDANEPVPTVTYGAKTLIKDTDYTVSYQDNINATTAAVVILEATKDAANTYTGNYKGTKEISFVITRAALVLSYSTDFLPAKISNDENTYTYDCSPADSAHNKLILQLGSRPLTDAELSELGIVYTVGDEKYAAVSELGIVTTTKYPGATPITATVSSSTTNFEIGAHATFYLISSADAAAAIPVTVQNVSLPYDGEEHTIEIVTELNDEEYQIKFRDAAGAYNVSKDASALFKTDAGTYTFYYELEKAGYNTARGSATLTIQKAESGLSFIEADVAKTYGDDPFAIDTNAAATYQGGINYRSSNNSVVSVAANGQVTINGIGTASIIAETDGTDNNHIAGNASYTITVNPKSLINCEVALPEDLSLTYTGRAQNPDVTVTDGALTLIKGTDYTAEYQNNVDAGTASVTIRGIGKYTGTVTKNFTIEKAALSTLTLANNTATFTSGEIAAVVSGVTADSDKITGLRENVDYTISYSVGDGQTGSLSANALPQSVGTYTVKATAKAGSNYSGEATAVFTVLMDSRYITIELSDSYWVYSGSAIEPPVSVKVNGAEVTPDSTVYTNNVDAGLATVTVTVNGETASKSFWIQQKPIVITDIGLADKLYYLNTSFTYNGELQGPSPANPLDQNDYIVSGTTSAKDAGEYIMTFTGTHNYCGRVDLYFKIVPKSLDTVNVSRVDLQVYNGNAITPDVLIKDGEKTLTRNVDYELTYSKDSVALIPKNVGLYDVEIKGINNYTGTAREFFNIEKASLPIKYPCAAHFKTLVRNTAVSGNDLEKPADYVGDIIYSSSNTSVAEINAAGQVIMKGVGNTVITATAEGDTNYKGSNASYVLGIDSIVHTENNYSGTYDGEAHAVSVSVSKPASDYTVSYSYTDENGTAHTDVNAAPSFTKASELPYSVSYTITASGYDTVAGSLSAKISKKSIASVEIGGIPSAVPYNGTPITCSELILTDGAAKLTESVDYKVSYLNNTNAGTATVTITGQGNYDGSSVCYFNIQALAGDLDISLSPSTFTYNGTEQKPAVVVKEGSTALQIDKDYVLSWQNPYSLNQGTYTVTATGIGGYEGSLGTASYTINRWNIASFVVTGIDNAGYPYSGSEICPEIVLRATAESLPLTKGKDYTVAYSNNTAVGNAMITITGIGNYDGTIEKTFSIVQNTSSQQQARFAHQSVSLSYAKGKTYRLADHNALTCNSTGTISYVSGNTNIAEIAADGTISIKSVGTTVISATIAADENYAAESALFTLTVTPVSFYSASLGTASYTYTGELITVTAAVTAMAADTTVFTLVEGVDYMLSYSTGKPTDVGTGYSVTVTGMGNYSDAKTLSFDVTAADLAVATVNVSNQTYTGSPISPVMSVSYNGRALIENTDYTVLCTGNTEVGTASVTLTGMGNFKGTKLASFEIVARANDSLVIAPVTDQTYSGSAIEPAVTITDSGRGDYELVKGTDYSLSYDNNTVVGNANITISYMGSYSGSDTAHFRIMPKNLDDVADSVVIASAPFVYSGSAIEPAVSLGSLNEDIDFTVSYANNVNAGAASVTLYGMGNYSGTRTAAFEIGQASLTASDVAAIGEQLYTGSPVTPEPVVSFGGRTLTKGLDYTVAYASNVNAGIDTAIATVSGIGNFTGDVAKSFTISVGAAGAMSVSLSDASFTYNESVQKPSLTVIHGGAPLDEAYYDISWSDEASTNVGTYEVTVTAKNGYSGIVAKEYTITPATLTGTVTLAFNSCMYTGNPIQPSMVLVDGKTEGVDYSVSLGDNITVGTATVTISGIGNYSGELVDSFDITARPVSEVNIAAIATQYYNGTALTPPVYMSLNGKLLVEGTDYTTDYANNDAIGTANVTVSGIGNFTGIKVLSFEIAEKQTVVVGGGGSSSTTVIEAKEIVIPVSQKQIDEAGGKLIFSDIEVPLNVSFRVESEGDAKLEIPTEGSPVGMVIAEVMEDGSLNIIKNSIVTENGVALHVSGTHTYQVFNNAMWFIDVPETSWAYESIAFTSARELFNGTGENIFSPKVPMTRNMMMTVLARFEGVDTSVTPLEKGLAWAMETGLSDGTNPENPITREQLATILFRYSNMRGYDTSKRADLSSFADSDRISNFAREGMSWAVASGIINGTGNNMLSPLDVATREQVSTFMQRYCVSIYER